MRNEIQTTIDAIYSTLELYKKSINWDASLRTLKELEETVNAPDFWNDANTAKEVMQHKASLERKIHIHNTLENSLNEAIELLEIATEENDIALIEEMENTIIQLQHNAREVEIGALLSGELDTANCFIEINAGAGGTESCDWVAMMVRMYQRWIEKKGYTYKTVEYTNGEEAGIKSITMQVQGEFSYGWLKTETGVHRLVRISPFDSSNRRHTSFASVAVYPEVNTNIEIVIEDKDLKIDTYRASGAGGQHVNTTDSAVRITHLPTKTVVQCQNQRSQHKNRDEAMKMLRAKMYEIQLQEQEAKQNDAYTQKADIGWGNQIRSYVLHPYQIVKDLRTNTEKTNAQAVLDGDLDSYMEAVLAQRNTQ